MTRKHFEAIAAAMRSCTGHSIYGKEQAARTQHALACDELAVSLAETNERFDRIRFLEACGLDHETADAL